MIKFLKYFLFYSDSNDKGLVCTVKKLWHMGGLLTAGPLKSGIDLKVIE